MMVLAVGAAHALARVDAATSVEEAEHAVEIVAEEPAPKPALPDINAHIVEVSTRHGVAPKLVAAIVAVESAFDHRAVSRRGAEGLMQLMPATAADLDVQDAFDPADNLDGGVRHLKRLMGRFRGDLPLALAAYNAGETAVIAHRGIPPYRETRQYVVRVLRRYDPEAARAVVRQLSAAARPARPAARPAAGPRMTLAREASALVREVPATSPAVLSPAVLSPAALSPELVEEPPRPARLGESP
jgi:soluble lytic murein transglycosylase-like protein